MIFDHIERISNLLRAEERREGSKHGLQAVQMEVLYYLSTCNRYSDTPAAVTEYMQSTKGTISQTLQVIESKGYIQKQADPKDRRVVHLKLTEEGKHVLDNSMPPPLFTQALDALSDDERQSIEKSLHHLLQTLHRANNNAGFGVCKTCRHCTPLSENAFICGLTKEALSSDDMKLICREHSTADSESE